MLTLALLVNWPSVICMNGQSVCYIKLVHTLLLEANHLSDPSKKTSFQQHQQKREREREREEMFVQRTALNDSCRFTIEVCRSISLLELPWEISPFWLLVFILPVSQPAYCERCQRRSIRLLLHPYMQIDVVWDMLLL